MAVIGVVVVVVVVVPVVPVDLRCIQTDSSWIQDRASAPKWHATMHAGQNAASSSVLEKMS